MIENHFKTTFSKDFLHTFLGRQLGFGCYREVYDCKFNEDLVIKLEIKDTCFHNIMEWEVWQKIQSTEQGVWFAPCRFISPCGKVLIQEKTEQISIKELPEFLPVFFTDTMKDNFGWIGNRVVCHDYGSTTLIENGLSNKVRKVEWW